MWGRHPACLLSGRQDACPTSNRSAPMIRTESPSEQGLYDPRYEHDSCGVGFVANLTGRKSHDIVDKAIQILENLEHRGACGCEPNTGDGAGILVQMPHAFLEQECGKRKIKLPAPGQYG